MRKFFVPKSVGVAAELTNQCIGKRSRVSSPVTSRTSATLAKTSDADPANLSEQHKTESTTGSSPIKRAKVSASESAPPISSFFTKPGSSAPSASSTSTAPSSSSSSSTHSDPASLLSAIPHYETILLPADIAVAQQTNNSLNSWTQHDGLLCRFRTDSSQRFERVVALDLDHTIITPHSNGRFPKDGDDWKFWHSEVPRILTELAQTGHGIVFLSNQQKLGNRAQSRDLSEFTRKVDTVIDTLGIPVDFLCSIGENRFRKPLTGMWEFYQVARGLPEMHVCFVGDAAGRPLHGTRAKDFSDTDIKFARNLHIPFYTPEKFFLRSTQRLHVQFPEVLSARRLIDYCSSHLHNHSHAVGVTVTHGRRIWKPAALAVVAVSAVDSSNSGSAASSTGQSTTDDVQKDSNAVPTESITAPEDATGNDDTVSFEQLIPPSWHGRQEVVLLVAAPASGKSTVALRFQQNHNYVRVNRDEMGSLEACLRKAQEAMQQGNSVVVDNTNLNATTRMAWTKLVREHNNAKKQCASDTSNVALRALVLDVPSEVCLQLARYRIADPMTREADRRHIPSGGLLSNLKEWMYDVHTTHFHPRYSPFFASHLFPAFAPTSSVLSSHRRLPNVSWWQMVIYSFFKNKEDVNMTKEGFDRVDVLSWQAKLPEHSAGQRLFRMYLS